MYRQYTPTTTKQQNYISEK